MDRKKDLCIKEKFLFRTVKEEEILTELKNLKRKKATGLDNLPPGLLKDAARVIAKPLTFIINLSLQTGVIPTDWKKQGDSHLQVWFHGRI